MSEEIIIINDEPFYKILNGTSYDYAPIPKEFKPYFEKLQQENKQLKENYKLIDKSMSELIEENQQLKQKYENAVADYESEKSKNQRAINDIDLVIELIKQQPTEDDSWILGRLNGFKIILKGENNK